MFLLKQLVKKGLGMFLVFIIRIYEWHSSQLVELWFHAGIIKA